jgi:uncharacterized protein YceK
MQYAMLSLTALLLAGCSAPVTVRNPQSGATVTCSQGAWDQSPWSQREACVADHIAQGWMTVDQK